MLKSGILGQQFELPQGGREGRSSTRLSSGPGQNAIEDEILSEDEMRELEKNNTVAALRKSGWKIYGSDGAAELLGIKPTTLVARIKKMEIRKSV